MIRKENLTVSRETFAAGRRDFLAEAEDALRPHIKEALSRVGLGSWEQQIVSAALDVFDLTARAEVEEGSQSLDDLRDLFAKDLGEALEKTKRSADLEKQLSTVTRWVAMMAHNAAMEAATSSDPDGNVGLEWVTMSDGDVRDSHSEANGQQVPTGSPFTVGKQELMYPGQPVGDPSVWINCRCVARATYLNALAVDSDAWTHQSDFGARSNPTTTDASFGRQAKTVADTASGRSRDSEHSKPIAGPGLNSTATSPAADSTTSATQKPSPKAGVKAESASTGSASTPATSRQLHPSSRPSAASSLPSAGTTATGSRPTAPKATPTTSGTPAGARGVTVPASESAGSVNASAPTPSGTRAAGAPSAATTGGSPRPTMLGELAADTVAANVSRETLAAGIKAAYPEATNLELYSTDVSRETPAQPCTCCAGRGEHICGHECYSCDASGTAEAQQSEVCAGHWGKPADPDRPDLDHKPEAEEAAGTVAADVSRETNTEEAPMEDNSGANTSSVIVALPEATDPLSAASSEKDGAHCTLLWFGDAAALDELALKEAIQQFIDHGQVTPVTDTVSGRATLGKDKADVVLLDAPNLLAVRSGLLEQNTLLAANESVDQHPTWLPHVTLGYPETPANESLVDEPGTPVTFDRLALWHGDSYTEFPLGAAAPAPEKEVTHPEDAGFTQQMADEVFASLVAAGAAPERIEPDVSRETDADVSRETLRPWHGVLAPEGAESGDSRGFAERMLTMRDLPLPLKAQFIDDEGHKGSVVVGRIDDIARDGGLIRASGVWDDSPDADRAWALIEKKMWRGVSVDLDAAEGEVIEASDGGQGSVVFSQGRVCSATLCAIPAFAEAFVRNGTWEDFADEPLPTGDMVEIPDWTAVSLVASASPDVVSADFFRNPELDGPTAVTRGLDGYIFGHLAEWSTCHTAYEVCTTVPPSVTDYAYFLTGQVFTDAGPVAVGQLTVGGGHADPKLGVRAAIAHYDNVASAVADITVGEDAYGVWFSGRIRPWATERQIHELFAAGPSGDWRGVRSRGRDSMELLAVHAVNVQGFPVARTRFAIEGGRQVSLIAAGMPDRDKLAEVDELLAEIRAAEFSMLTTTLTTLEGK